MNLHGIEFGSTARYDDFKTRILTTSMTSSDHKEYLRINTDLVNQSIKNGTWNRKFIAERIKFVNEKLWNTEYMGGRIHVIPISSIGMNSRDKANVLVHSLDPLVKRGSVYLFLLDPDIRSEYIKWASKIFPKNFFHYSDTILLPVLALKEHMSGLVTPPPAILKDYGKHEKIRKVSLLSTLNQSEDKKENNII